MAELGELLNKPLGTLSPSNASCIEFDNITDEHLYKINIIKELNDAKYGNPEVNIFSNDELDKMLSSWVHPKILVYWVVYLVEVVFLQGSLVISTIYLVHILCKLKHSMFDAISLE